MSKITLNSIADLTQTTTAQTTINANFSTIQAAFDNPLSRDGTSPNQMGSALDMNSFPIINLPVAIGAASPVTLGQIAGSPLAISITGVPGGCSGRLTGVSSTSLAFTPFNGSSLVINGTANLIPSSGISGGSNTNVFVNGVASQNLAASTFYYIFAFLNSNVITFDFRTDGNGHMASPTAGNLGTEVRVSSGTTPDDTRTLIGMTYTNSAAHFVDLQTASWFNRRLKGAVNFDALVNPVVTSAFPNYVEVDSVNLRLNFVSWADEAVDVRISGASNNNTSGSRVYNAIGFDGNTNLVAFGLMTSTTALHYESCSCSCIQSGLSEGFHFASLYGAVDTAGQIAKWAGGAQGAGGDNTSIWVGIRG